MVSYEEAVALLKFTERHRNEWRFLTLVYDADLLEPHYHLIARSFRKRGWKVDTRYQKSPVTGETKRYLAFIAEPIAPVPVTDSERKLMKSMLELLEESGGQSVALQRVSDICGDAYTLTRKRAVSLIEKGLLTRLSVRGGYAFTDEGLELVGRGI